MTLGQFSEVFALLAVQLRATDVDEATIRGYYAALKDLDLELVAMAAQRMGQQGGAVEGDNRHWFPKTSEWRVLTGKIEGERTEALRAVLRKLPLPLCRACEDTGWIQASKIGDQHSNNARWKHCDCRTLRRLEVLGRRPMPQLTDGSQAEVRPVDLTAIVQGAKGM